MTCKGKGARKFAPVTKTRPIRAQLLQRVMSEMQNRNSFGNENARADGPSARARFSFPLRIGESRCLQDRICTICPPSFLALAMRARARLLNPMKKATELAAPAPRLCLSQIRSARIGDAIHQGPGGRANGLDGARDRRILIQGQVQVSVSFVDGRPLTIHQHLHKVLIGLGYRAWSR